DNYLGKEYVVSRSTYWYKRELANSQAPNQKFEILYRLGDVLLDHNATQSDVAARLGSAGTVSTQSGGGWNIDVSSTYTGEGGLGLFSASDICAYKERETVSLYMEQIGFATVTAYEWAIEDAMTACGGFSCNACIDPICVFNELHSDLAGNPSDQEKVRVAFLAYGLGLSESEVNNISSGVNDFIVAELYNNLSNESIFCERALNVKSLVSFLSGYISVNSTNTTTNISEILAFMLEKEYSLEATQASQMVLNLLSSSNGLTASFETGLYDGPPVFISYVPVGLFVVDAYVEYQTQCAILRDKNPSWSDDRIALNAAWNVLNGYLHTSLDICGLVPGFGEPCDFTNGVLYVIQGDGVSASLSFAATIPIAGWVATVGKYAKIGVETATGFVELTLRYDEVTGYIVHELPDWWNATFRSMVGVTDVAKEAHHLIPKSLYDNVLIQKASQSIEIPYHIHHPKNGLGILKSIHDAPHYDYINAVSEKLGDIAYADGTIAKKMSDIYGSIDAAPAEVVQAEVVKFQDWLRNLLEQNPNTPLNNLASVISTYIP
ncbi:MAG: AHH domain-containing protein, partial [Bacteroidetes bacterium]|nr:AHH domain-containing protein [Bacteroidota bacterium]